MIIELIGTVLIEGFGQMEFKIDPTVQEMLNKAKEMYPEIENAGLGNLNVTVSRYDGNDKLTYAIRTGASTVVEGGDIKQILSPDDVVPGDGSMVLAFTAIKSSNGSDDDILSPEHEALLLAQFARDKELAELETAVENGYVEDSSEDPQTEIEKRKQRVEKYRRPDGRIDVEAFLRDF